MRAWEHTGVDAVAIHDPQIESAERGHHVYAIAAVLDIEGRNRERSNGVYQEIAEFQIARTIAPSDSTARSKPQP
jgi:hypothetical protein